MHVEFLQVPDTCEYCHGLKLSLTNMRRKIDSNNATLSWRILLQWIVHPLLYWCQKNISVLRSISALKIKFALDLVLHMNKCIWNCYLTKHSFWWLWLWHIDINRSNTSIFLVFRYNWCFMLSLFKYKNK